MRMRLYTRDPGGYDVIAHLVRLGIIEAVDVRALPRAWEAFGAVVRGRMWDGKKWETQPIPDDIGIIAYEGISTWSDGLMGWLRGEWKEGRNHGGGRTTPPKFTDGTYTVAGNSEGHYALVQDELVTNIQLSFQLPCDYLIWTAHPRRPEQDVTDLIIGPEGAGKKLTARFPSWFNYTWRLQMTPPDYRLLGPDGIKGVAEADLPVKEHRLYLSGHKDMTSGGAVGLANDRTPLDASALPLYITPASLVRALELVKGKVEEAQANVVKELQA